MSNEIDLSGNEFSPCVSKAINYINKNLSETLTIKDIADAIFVSESTLTKHMRKELGTTVNNYIDDLILTLAAQMIAEGQYSLNAISNRFGFCDQFYFSRKFKALVGKTFTRYVVDCRLEKAAELLLCSHKTVDVVLVESGFSSRGEFFQKFEQRYGETPLQFRKNQKSV